jgi:hypothetical protein
MNAVQTTWNQGPSNRLLVSFIPAFLRDPGLAQKSVQNPYKSDQFREVQFSNTSAANTYNFNALKCTDFAAADLNLKRALNLNLISRPHSCQLVCIRGYNPKLTKTDRFRPIMPGTYYTNKRCYSPSEETKWDKTGQNTILTKLDCCATATCNDNRPSRPIFNFPAASDSPLPRPSTGFITASPATLC